MKKSLKKLLLSKETLRTLDDRELDAKKLEQAAGGQSATCYKLSLCTCTHTRYC
jgi:hypothetical protein